MVIGVSLGWLFFKEKVSSVCRSGIGLVFSGAALLVALGQFFDRLMAKVWSLTINDARLFFLNQLNR
jgi:drug/metabolite transporter (DMT)-like permease